MVFIIFECLRMRFIILSVKECFSSFLSGIILITLKNDEKH